MRWRAWVSVPCVPVLTVAVLAVAGLPASTAHAQAPWSFYPTLGLRAGVYDNVNLREEGGDTAYEGTASVGGIVEQVSEFHQYRLTGVVGYTAYTGDDEAPDDGDFQSVVAEAGFREERTTWRTTGTFLRDTASVTSSVPTDEVDPGADIDTVTEDRSVRRIRASFGATVEHDISERWLMNAGYLLRYLDYDDDRELLPEVLNHDVEGRAGYRLSPITTVGLGVQVGFLRPREDPAGQARSINTYALIGDVEHRVTERSTLRASAGVRYSDVKHDSTIDDDVGFLGRLEAITRGMNWRMSATLERRLLPDRRGFLRETDQIRLRGSREISPRLEAAVTARAFNARRPDTAGDDRSTEYASFSPSLTYMLTPEWSLSGEYHFEFRDESDIPGDATGNAVFLSLDFTPRRRARGF